MPAAGLSCWSSSRSRLDLMPHGNIVRWFGRAMVDRMSDVDEPRFPFVAVARAVVS
jgi:hypothetical protein